MNRRQFLGLSGKLSLAPLLLNGTSIRSFATPLMLTTCDGISDRILVIIRMSGGNDGFNTIIPINMYDDLAAYRSNIQIPDSGSNAYITLDSSLSSEQQVGLHPTMTGFKDLYDNGMLSVIQAVGYPNHNRSHFKSTDLILNGIDGTLGGGGLNTGWMGRYLDYSYPSVAGNPNLDMPDPLGIELGGTSSSAGFFSVNPNSISVNLGGQDAAGFYNQVSSIGSLPPSEYPLSDFGSQLEYVYGMQNSLEVYAERISTVFEAGANSVTYPVTSLANQLKTVARLISGGSKTKVYLCEIGGFDTHSQQVDVADHTIGPHTNLLNTLSEAILAFQNDLSALGLADRVLGCTFSEFGRKVISNGSTGTDHGNFAPSFVFGAAAAAGVLGINPNINNQDAQGALNAEELQHDYRQIFATLLQDWLGASDNAMNAAMFGDFTSNKIAIVEPSMVCDEGCRIDTFTGLSAPISVSIFGILEGAYLGGVSIMHTKLMDEGLVPYEQPFNTAPWYYAGTESFAENALFKQDIVDWVMVELRDPSNSYNVMSRQAALLLDDGQVVNTEGTTLQFNDVSIGSYYVVLRARNHIDLITDSTVPLPNLGQPVNFADPGVVMGGSSQLKQINPAIYAMIGGDYNNEGVVTVSDHNAFSENMSNINVYEAGDGNMDGNITVVDFNIYKDGASTIGVEQVRFD